MSASHTSSPDPPAISTLSVSDKVKQERITTADTRGPPDVDQNTHIVAVLGVFEDIDDPEGASPAVGGGWFVSDFYLWMNVLKGMGKSQQWITCLDPEYLLDKYCGEDKIEQKVRLDSDGREICYNMWTKWKTGLIHGDPFEERAVVLDHASLAFAKSHIDLVENRQILRGHFLMRLRQALSNAASNEKPDPVLILAFCHGDFESGGLLIGVRSKDRDSYVNITDIATMLAEYPRVPVTIFMTSCYSGHWVVSQEFHGSTTPPTIMAGALEDEETHGFAWSSSLRHAGGVFSGAFLRELLKEPHFEDVRSDLPEDVSSKTARTYNSMTRAILAEAHRLCLPDNTPQFGSTPMFTTAGTHDKFWKRTGYSLHDYKSNYDSLVKIPPSDPHPKYNRKIVVDGIIDDDDSSVIEWNKRNPDWMDLFGNSDEYADATGGYGTTLRGLYSTANMMFLIRQYLLSKPGCNESAWNIHINGLILQYKMGMMSQARTADLRRLLIYRLQMNELADIIAKELNLTKLPSISQWDLGHQKLRGGHHPEASKIMRIIIDSGIFRRPYNAVHGYPGPGYQKPHMYLAYAMVESGYDAEGAKGLLARIKTLRYRADTLTERWTRTDHGRKTLKRLGDVVDEAWEESKHRAKRARPSLQSTGWMDGGSGG